MNRPAPGSAPPKPSFREALSFWIRLGFISFGGPAGQIAIMHEYLVEKRRWISDSRFLHALNYCMLLPGPEAQQLATYTGWLLHGTKGGLVAGLFFVLPSLFILLGLSTLYAAFGNIPWIYALFSGLKPAVIAIVLIALLRIARKSLLSAFHYGVALTAFVCLFFFNVSFPLIILGAIAVAALMRWLMPGIFQETEGSAGRAAAEEKLFYLNKYSVLEHTAFHPGKMVRQIIAALGLWALPFALFYLFSADFLFWKRMILFFTQAAFVTFGGAYAVLPYVAQVSVEQFNWLNELQMIDGLALGETTPGPLVMVLSFVGFMAGFNHFGASLGMGALGLLTTAFYTFLPCFLFILVGGPLIERTQENRQVKQMLGLVTAAVVGVIFNLTIYLGRAVLFPGELSLNELDWLSLAWIAVSFVAMYRFKLSMITWIGVSVLFGLASFWLGLT